MNTRLFLLLAALMLPLALAACGDDEAPAPPPETYAPLRSDYLTKLRLNVGSIDVQDNAVPQGDNDLAAQSPIPPAAALAQLARDRLFAAGLTGHATFVIDQASIVRGQGGVLDGTLAIHLDVFDATGVRIGFAEARVARQHIPGTDPENLRNVLYDMTKSLIDSMNVELEYQLKRSLSALLVTGTAVPAAVTATPLQPAAPMAPAPPGIPGVDLSPGAPAQAPMQEPGQAPPPAQTPPPDQMAPPPEQTAPPPEQMSPPPGFLQLPPAAQPPAQYQ